MISGGEQSKEERLLDVISGEAIVGDAIAGDTITGGEDHRRRAIAGKRLQEASDSMKRDRRRQAITGVVTEEM